LPIIFACEIDSKCPYYAVLIKEWYDATGNLLDGPPADLPPSYAITAQSIYGSVICTYPTGSTALVCTYINNPPGNNLIGLWVPYHGAYTVTESGLPSGWVGIAGTGNFTLDDDYCVNISFENMCIHAVKNQSVMMR
jgi:hypothetical protein